MVDTIRMPRKRTGRAHERDEDYRLPAKTVRIRMELAGIAAETAKMLAQDLTQFVNDAVRERLERMGKWPAIQSQPEDK